jgi:opacity protein-like surface antigen
MKLIKQSNLLTIFFFTNLFLFSYPFVKSSFSQNANFGGYYGGIQVGVADTRTIHNDYDNWYFDYKNLEETSIDPTVGLKFGFDVVNGSQIYGYLVEGSFLSSDTNTTYYGGEGPAYRIGSKIKAIGSLRGKYGIVSDKLAVYGTAGFAFADIKHTYVELDGTEESFDNEGKNQGYVFGVGTSYAFDSKKFISLDISQYRFKNKNHMLLESDGTPTDYTFGIKDTINTINISYNLKF